MKLRLLFSLLALPFFVFGRDMCFSRPFSAPASAHSFACDSNPDPHNPKNLFLANIPLRSVYKVFYARSVQKHWAVEAGYHYFSVNESSNGTHPTFWSTASSNGSRKGATYSLSGRFYFKRMNFNGFYLRSGFSFTHFKGEKITFTVTHNPLGGLFGGDGRDVFTTNHQSALVLMYSGLAGVGCSLKSGPMVVDMNFGTNPSIIRYHQHINDYWINHIPLFATFTIGFTI